MKSELQIRYNVLVNHKFEQIADNYAIEFAEWFWINKDKFYKGERDFYL